MSGVKNSVDADASAGAGAGAGAGVGAGAGADADIKNTSEFKDMLAFLGVDDDGDRDGDVDIEDTPEFKAILALLGINGDDDAFRLEEHQLKTFIPGAFAKKHIGTVPDDAEVGIAFYLHAGAIWVSAEWNDAVGIVRAPANLSALSKDQQALLFKALSETD